jgi:heat shock protein HtpX
MTPLPVRRSMLWWAALAVLMVVGSYTLTLVLAAFCILGPGWLLLLGFGGFHTYVMFGGGVLTAVTLLWSLYPRRIPFVIPGPLLTAESHPRLFKEITATAAALNEPLPREVYLTGELNASVAQGRGRGPGAKRRVMTIGLPLMQIVSIAQFRAIIAHEFGHYYSGDTRLGPWVYNSRATMARTLDALTGDSPLMEIVQGVRWAAAIHALVHLAIDGYWRIFLKATQLVSRHQELRADELAAHLTSPEALASGLMQIHGASLVVPAFWYGEVAPALEAGYLPPLAEGFARFVAVPAVKNEIAQHLSGELKTRRTDALDSHPALRDRIAALKTRTVFFSENEHTAISLLNGLDSLEKELLRTVAPSISVAELKPVAWNEIGKAWVKNWRRFAESGEAALSHLLIDDLVGAAANIRSIVLKIPDPPGELPTREQRAERAFSLLQAALSVALDDQGWALHTGPGENFFSRGEEIVDPGAILREIREGAITQESWRERCNTLGLSGLRLLNLQSEM